MASAYYPPGALTTSSQVVEYRCHACGHGYDVALISELGTGWAKNGSDERCPSCRSPRVAPEGQEPTEEDEPAPVCYTVDDEDDGSPD